MASNLFVYLAFLLGTTSEEKVSFLEGKREDLAGYFLTTISFSVFTHYHNFNRKQDVSCYCKEQQMLNS